MSLTGVNDAPVVANEIKDQAINNVDVANIDISSNFSDVDENDSITFSEFGLPDGLTMDAAGMITGTPTASGTYSVTITAEDMATETVSDTFELTVQGVITGTANGDRLSADSKPNQVNGEAGNDNISGYGDDDYLIGGEGNDYLKGGTGNDLLEGGVGLDRLLGGRGMDTLSGGEGNDLLKGGTDDDMLMGDAGLDRLYGGKGADTFILQVDMGLDTIYNFDLGEDILELADGFTGTLSSSSSGRNTTISIVESDTPIALLRGITDVTLESLSLA